MSVATLPKSLLDRIVEYDGHLVVASRTGSGKTTLELNYIARQKEVDDSEFLICTGKQSVWMGLEDQQGQDALPRVINISLSDASSIEPLLQRLRWCVKTQETREQTRVEKRKAGQKVNPRPIRILIDEWLVVVKVAKKHGKDSFKELIDLVETIVFKGREDRVFITLVAQGHHCGTLHLDGDLRMNLGVIALGGAENYQSITAAISDGYLVEDAYERKQLQEQYQRLISEDPQGRIFYTSIGGHTVERMEVLPDMQEQQLYEPDIAPTQAKIKDMPKTAHQGASPCGVRSGFDSGFDDGASPVKTKAVEGFVSDDDVLDYAEEKLSIERKRLNLEALALRLQANTPDEVAEARWNLITLGVGVLVFGIYTIPPFSGALRGAWQASVKVAETAKKGAEELDKTIDEVAPALKATPKTGERIAGYLVTSPFGMRDHPVHGGKKMHRGVDLGTPVGTALYAVGRPGQKVNVKCLKPEESGGGGITAVYQSMGWEFLAMHLSNCQSGESIAGQIIARTGNTGHSTGPHLHWEQREPGGEAVPPQKWTLWAAINGELPRPTFSRDQIEDKK